MHVRNPWCGARSIKDGAFGTLQMLLSQDIDVIFGPICSEGSKFLIFYILYFIFH